MKFAAAIAALAINALPAAAQTPAPPPKIELPDT